jgi:hypothetical protein
MSRTQALNWGKIASIATVIVALPFVGAWIGQGVDIVRVPARESATEQRLTDLETNCAAQFQHLNWKLDHITSLLTN